MSQSIRGHWSTWPTFETKVTITQVVAVPSPIGLIFSPGPENIFNEMIVFYIGIGNDDYGAGRVTEVFLMDSASSIIVDLMLATIDNTRISGPTLRTTSDNTTGTTAVALGSPSLPFFISGGNRLIIRAAALTDGETITIKIHGKIRDRTPTLAVVAGAETLTVTENKIIA